MTFLGQICHFDVVDGIKEICDLKGQICKRLKNLNPQNLRFLPLFQIQLTVEVVTNKNFTQVIFKGLFILEACLSLK